MNNDARARVRLAPLILVRVIRGWAREGPWYENAIEPDLHNVHDRLGDFVNRLGMASIVGDVS